MVCSPDVCCHGHVMADGAIYLPMVMVVVVLKATNRNGCGFLSAIRGRALCCCKRTAEGLGAVQVNLPCGIW